MTRLQYDIADRKVIEAVQKGMNDYEMSADERVAGIKHDRATSTNNKKSDLRKLAAFGKV